MTNISITNDSFETLSPVRTLLKRFVINPAINHLLPKDFLRSVLKESKSPLVQEALRSPGSWRSMKISYENKPPVDFIDMLVLKYGTFPMGLRNRKRLVVRKITKLIQHYLEQGEVNINVVAVGAGSGANTIEALGKNPYKNVIAYLFDIEDEAFAEGEALKKLHAVVDRVHFIKADMRTMPNYVKSTPHILELIGILEYFTDDEVLIFLKDISVYLNRSSSVVVNSIEDAHGVRQFLKRIFDFELIYRTPAQMIELLKEAGYENFDIEREPLKVYSVITAHKKI